MVACQWQDFFLRDPIIFFTKKCSLKNVPGMRLIPNLARRWFLIREIRHKLCLIRLKNRYIRIFKHEIRNCSSKKIRGFATGIPVKISLPIFSDSFFFPIQKRPGQWLYGRRHIIGHRHLRLYDSLGGALPQWRPAALHLLHWWLHRCHWSRGRRRPDVDRHRGVSKSPVN